MTPFKTKIYSVGTHLPEQIVKSDDIFLDIKSETQYNIPTKWMSETMGIIERRIAPEGAMPSDLAIPAAEKAIANSDIKPDMIDMVIFCGIERDQPEPATAHKIQSLLGINAKYAFDVANACYGFMDAITIASNFISNGSINYALIVTGEIPSRVLKGIASRLKKGVSIKKARKLIGALSVGDAGGAILIGASNQSRSGFEMFNTVSDSQHRKKCFYNFDKHGVPDGEMLMGPITNLISRHHENLIDDTLKKLGWNRFDWMLSHQMGQRPFDRISSLQGVRPSRVIKTFDKLGNITSATFPVNFEMLLNNDRLKKGDKVGGCFAGSGLAIGQFGYTI